MAYITATAHMAHVHVHVHLINSNHNVECQINLWMILHTGWVVDGALLLEMSNDLPEPAFDLAIIINTSPATFH